MAYNAANEERTELYCERKNSRGDYLVVTKIVNTKSGTEAVDIRNYYTNNEGELAPTSKGIRINCENLLDVMKAMVKAMELDEADDLRGEIEAMLDDSSDDCDEEATYDEDNE